ncbi:MAG: helix-turn-helix domain-containing protein [Fimbriimonadales bacterium]
MGDSQAIGKRIRWARKARGLSLRALARAIGKSHEATRKYESGQLVPDSQMLLRLSAALETPVEFFLRPITVEPSQIRPAYRKKSVFSKCESDALNQQIAEWLERYLQIEHILGIQAPPLKRIAQTINRLEDVEAAAVQLREDWDIGLDPIANLTELLEDQGIKILKVDRSDLRFDGCAFWHGDQSAAIIVNSSVSTDRKRFSLAHELAHLVLEINPSLKDEAVANRFAGAFLVPKQALLMELGTRRHYISLAELCHLKQKYGMSMQAWIYRARDLGVLSRERAEQLFRQFSTNGWRKHEPTPPLPPEAPRRMEMLIRRAYSEGLISDKRASELMGLSLKEWLQLTQSSMEDSNTDVCHHGHGVLD